MYCSVVYHSSTIRVIFSCWYCCLCLAGMIFYCYLHGAKISSSPRLWFLIKNCFVCSPMTLKRISQSYTSMITLQWATGVSSQMSLSIFDISTCTLKVQCKKDSTIIYELFLTSQALYELSIKGEFVYVAHFIQMAIQSALHNTYKKLKSTEET